MASLISVSTYQFTAADNVTQQDKCAQPSKYTLNHTFDSDNTFISLSLMKLSGVVPSLHQCELKQNQVQHC